MMWVSKTFPIWNDRDWCNALGFSKADNEVKMNFICTTLFLISSLSAWRFSNIYIYVYYCSTKQNLRTQLRICV